MKKLSALLLIPLLTLCACAYAEPDEIIQPKQPGELLQFSVWAMKEDLPEGYFSYDPTDLYNYGSYQTESGSIHADEVFEIAVLEVGRPRTCAPLGYKFEHNLNLRVDSDGYVEIMPDPSDDDRIRLAHSVNEPDSTDLFKMTQENKFIARSPMTLNICPVGRFTPESMLILRDTLTDREYYLTVNAYDLNKRPTATARLKLTVLDDGNYPSDTVKSGIYGQGESRSRFLQIELVSCEYGKDTE